MGLCKLQIQPQQKYTNPFFLPNIHSNARLDKLLDSPHNAIVLKGELTSQSQLAIRFLISVALTLSILGFDNSPSTVTTSNTQRTWIRVCHSIRATNRRVLQCHKLRTNTSRSLIHNSTTGQWVTAVDLGTWVAWEFNLNLKIRNHKFVHDMLW